MTQPAQFLSVEMGGNTPRRIAYRHLQASRPGRPGLVWLCGFNSDMISTKASALAEWAGARGIDYLRFDYSGHGESGGRLEDFTIGHWLADTQAAFALTRGPQVVVGSSMGGWLALLLARALQANPADRGRLAALVLIAPAWDMTEALMWDRFTPEARAAIAQTGVFHRPSQYGDPYPLTRDLIEEGRTHLIGAGMTAGCPVRILQGMRDPDVPWEHAVRLINLLEDEDVRMTLVKDGEHRLSRDGDLAALHAMIGEFIPPPGEG